MIYDYLVTNGLEIISVIFGLICVYYVIKEDILCWPTGLIYALISVYIFYDVKLYSDLILHIFYVFMQIFGWYYWLHGGKGDTELKVSFLKIETLVLLSVGTLAGALGWGYGMKLLFPEVSLPYPDAFTTVGSLVGQWLMVKKKVESWYFWIAVDIVGTVIYAMKGIYFYSGLYFVYLVLSVLGYKEWKRSYEQEPQLATVNSSQLKI